MEHIRITHHVPLNGDLTFHNNIFESEVVSTSVFFYTRILAVLKIGKSEHDPYKYCPIASLSLVCKILDRMIYNRIYQIIEEAPPPEQLGFVTAKVFPIKI